MGNCSLIVHLWRRTLVLNKSIEQKTVCFLANRFYLMLRIAAPVQKCDATTVDSCNKVCNKKLSNHKLQTPMEQ